MITVVVRIDPDAPDPALIEQAARVLREGGLVAFPTETVYGLGANALSSDAVARIFTAKGRPSHNPIIVHIADLQTTQSLTTIWPPEAKELAQHFWPGPLTLVLPRSERVPDIVTGGGGTVGLRMPAHPVALALVRAAGVPIAAPSANRSTELSPTRAEHVLRGLDGRIDMVLDAGATTGGLESTVLDLSSDPTRLLRPGLIAPGQIEQVIGPIQRHVDPPSTGALPSPGLLARHYAPRTPLLLTSDLDSVAKKLRHHGRRFVCLVQGDVSQPDTLLMPDSASEYAACLYDVLHRLDRVGYEAILVQLPPAGEDWLAIHDRLRRAARIE